MILYYATLSSHLTELRNLIEIYYYGNKADENGIKTALIKSQTDIIENNNVVNKTWDICRTTIDDNMKKYISTSTRNSHPWINRNINKLTRKKNRAHKKARSTKKLKDWNRYAKLKSACQKKIRKSHESYLQDIVSGDMKIPV
jgi:thiamine kinase-like enzyme